MSPVWRNTITACMLAAVLAAQVSAQNERQLIPARMVDEAPAVYIQAGVLGTLLLQDEIQSHAGSGYTAGIGIRRHTEAHAFIWLQLNYQQFCYSGMQNRVYDAGFGTAVNLSTSLDMRNLEFPLLYGIEQKKFSAALGLAASLLLRAKLNQHADAGGSSNTAAIFEKYTKTDVQGISPFSAANISPCLYLGWMPYSRFILSLATSCELLANPVAGFSYFGPYRFIQNKVLITFKI